MTLGPVRVMGAGVVQEQCVQMVSVCTLLLLYIYICMKPIASQNTVL